MLKVIWYTILTLALAASVGCGKVEIEDTPQAPQDDTNPGGTFGTDLTYNFQLTISPIDTTMDPQLSNCHRQLKNVVSLSQYVKPGNSVRLSYDGSQLFQNNKLVGNLSSEPRNFFFDNLIPNLANANADFETQIEMHGHAQRMKGFAFAYAGKTQNGKFQKFCSIPLELAFRLLNN